MKKQLAYVLLTPHTVDKSRTGAIISRLLSSTNAELIAARMFAPNKKLAEAYANSIKPILDSKKEQRRNLIRNYIRENFIPAKNGIQRRVMMLVFQGENARSEIRKAVGTLEISNTRAQTIRDAYGDLIYNPDQTVRYFEPALLTGPTELSVKETFKIWLEYAQEQSAILDNVCQYEKNSKNIERTLVLIKPDSWRPRSSRPGQVIKMFSTSGLQIIGCKLCYITVEQALNFYGQVKQVLEEKLAPNIGEQARNILSKELDFELPQELEQTLADTVGKAYANDQFESLVEFMSGCRPSQCKHQNYNVHGGTKVLAIVYQGENAIQKIREILGPTDPTKAPGGTVRSEFGTSVMINTAHASDSQENAMKEIKILEIDKGNFVQIVQQAIKNIDA